MDGVDTISDLPDHILHLILSRLPSTEEVHRTNILSKRWRYLWTSIPSIDTDYARQKYRKGKWDMFEEFVYWVLATKSSDLDSFRLCYPGYYHVSRVEHWIRIAVMRRVKVVDLMICHRVWCEKLSIRLMFPVSGVSPFDHSRDNAEARRILGACLKRVEFLQFKGERRKLPVVRSLLKHGNVLEKMVFNWHNYYRDKSIKTMKKVSKFPKASSTVKLITLINESTTKVQ
ncbi:hypothetical protein LXL04_029249 [Taraxacum kok-saghyz]